MYIWVALCITSVAAYHGYHTKSMEFTAPASATNELPATALFGFSVAFQPTLNRLIVGAPRADHVGRIYVTDLRSAKTRQWNLSSTNLPEYKKKPRSYSIGKYVQEYSDYWLGATVAAVATFYVACAPRFMDKYKPPINKATSKHINQGLCFKAMNLDGMKEMQRMHATTRARNITDSYADTAGWSLNIASDDTVLVGGQGLQAKDKGSVLEYSPKDKYPNVIKYGAPDYNIEMIKYNLGFSVASGNYFSTNKSNIIYAIGSNYGHIGKGKVIFIDPVTRSTVHEITDWTPGNMYSAALCSLALNDDGFTDLIVGAPTAKRDDDDNSYDVGAVHVYISNNNTKFIHMWTIFGNVNSGYFGRAIANIGDMDGDKKDEIVIAAPYEDDGRGAIYLFSGDQLMGATKPQAMQRIVPRSTTRYFGYSLAALLDFDNNGRYGLAVGSPESNEVSILNHILLINIDLQVKEYAMQRKENTKFDFENCLIVTRPAKPTIIQAKIEVTTTINHPKANIKGLKNYTYFELLQNNTGNFICQNISIDISEVIDLSKPIRYLVSVKQLGDPVSDSEFRPSNALLIKPFVEKRGNIYADSDCKNPKACQPDLRLSFSATLPTDYLVGSTNSENVSLIVSNPGETAYRAYLIVEVIGAGVKRKTSTCTLIKKEGTKVDAFKCTLDIMKKNSVWNVSDGIILDTSTLTNEDTTIGVNVKLYNDETDVKPIEQNITSHLIYDTKGFNVTGSPEKEMSVRVSEPELYDEGKHLEHTYRITNIGVTNWRNMKCKITLAKLASVKYNGIKIYTQQNNEDCPFVAASEGETLTVVCNLGSLLRQETIEVYIDMRVLPNTLNEILTSQNFTISSTLELLDSRSIVSHTTTVKSLLMLVKSKVPWWIIASGVALGLLILCIIIFILYKTGFLKRKKKENLVQLKRRASQRMSMRSSTRDQRSSIVLDECSGMVSYRHSVCASPTRRPSMAVDTGPRCTSVLVTNRHRMNFEEVDFVNRNECRNRLRSRDDEEQEQALLERNVIVHNSC